MLVVAMSHGELSRYDTLLRFARGELRAQDTALLLGICRTQICSAIRSIHSVFTIGKNGKPILTFHQ